MEGGEGVGKKASAYFDFTLDGHENVGALQVAMHNALVVQVFQSLLIHRIINFRLSQGKI